MHYVKLMPMEVFNQHLDRDADLHLRNFFETFVQGNQRRRLKAIMESKPQKWRLVLSNFEATKGTGEIFWNIHPDITFSRVYGHPKIKKYLKARCWIFETNGARQSSLEDALEKVREGIISVIPGLLAIVKDHEDVFTVLSK
jgi:hypothetical protein